MLSKLMPREVAFFDYFDRQSEKIVEGCKAVQELLENYVDVVEKAKRIKAIEHEGDVITHECIERLHTTFITPFDREDIRSLASDLDDIVDHLESVAKYLVLFELAEAPEPLRRFAEILTSMAEEIDKIRVLIWDMGNLNRIQESMVRISELENEGDSLYFTVISELFRKGCMESIEILKWKEVYEGLEEACDRCKDFTHVVGNVVIKNA